VSAGLTNDRRDTRSFARDDHDTRHDAPAAPHARPMLAMIAALSLAAVGVALVSQHMFDMQPCPWCIVQRIAYAAIGIVALAAAVLPSRVAVHRWASLLVGVLATLGAASALWQQLFAAKSSSCVMTAADSIIAFTRLDSLLPEVFQARASCADASAPLLGLPYPLWSLLLFIALAVAALRVHLEQRGR
jgi:disulfide bond formation protein DsbB